MPDNNKAQDIKSLSHEELTRVVLDLGLPPYRVSQIEEWLYAKGCVSFDDMTNLPKALRNELRERFNLFTPAIAAKQVSEDGTRKYLFRLADGTMVESVGIPSHKEKRLTVCFSTQAGCSMGCSFCATGRSGFSRNLHPGEIFDQLRLVGDDFGQRVSGAVGMGQGEPFLNYASTLEAMRRINKQLGVGARHLTVSTCGIIDGIKQLAEEPEQFTLAVSLHSAIQSTRDRIMPGVRAFSLSQLGDALRHYSQISNRRPTLEFAPISNTNDSDEEIRALLDFCEGLLCHVNLIPLNPVDKESPDALTLQPSPRMANFCSALRGRGVEHSVRKSRGADIDGACGQLRQRFIE